jgi:repressor LexA
MNNNLIFSSFSKAKTVSERETMDKKQLTTRQQEIYDFILEKIRSRGYGPTVREIGAAFDIQSPNGVMCHLQALQKKGLIRREKGRSRAIQIVQENHRDPGIPLLGTVAAGLPIETYEQTERIDFRDLFDRPEFYALEVRGQSMIEDHIDDGDYVIVRRQQTAQEGQMVVARVDESGETTLKRFYRDHGRFRLEPANSSMSPIFCDQVDIQGVVVGVVRKF